MNHGKTYEWRDKSILNVGFADSAIGNRELLNHPANCERFAVRQSTPVCLYVHRWFLYN